MTKLNSIDSDTAVLTGPLPDSGCSGEAGEVTLLEIATELARRKALLAKCAGGAMAAGLAVAFLLPVRYTAEARIMPPQQTPSSASLFISNLQGGASSSLSQLAGASLGLKNPSDIYIGLLNSRPVADAIIRSFDLQSVYHCPDMTGARKKLAGNTRIDSEKSGLIAIAVTDRDKKRAAAMANAYTAQLRNLTQSLAVTEASQRRVFYEQQLAQTGEALVAAKLAFQQVQQTKGLVALDAQARAMIEGLADLRAQIAAKQVQLQAMRTYSTDRNPGVELAERELATLQSEAARLDNHASDSGGLGLGDVPGAGREYLSAEHELAYRQTLYDLLIKQYDAARLDEAKEAAIIQVVEPAAEPDRKSSPRRAAIVVLSALIGLFAGYIWIRLELWLKREQADPARAEALDRLKCALLPCRLREVR